MPSAIPAYRVGPGTVRMVAYAKGTLQEVKSLVHLEEIEPPASGR
ncbi:MAG: hypothetical protein ACRD04_05520 [Terriglobales bacterium]